jgi:hypothetical protein
MNGDEQKKDDVTRDPWHGDEHHGQGGSYVFDPEAIDEKTGKPGVRTLVERTEIPEPGAAGDQA